MQSLKERWETLASIHLCSVFSFSLIASLALFGGLVIFFFVLQKLMKTPLSHTLQQCLSFILENLCLFW